MESLTPLVSVLLPVKAWRSTTLSAVESILAQSLSRIEVIVIGQDDVHRIIDNLPNDERIKGISRKGPGIVAALNTGLAHAKSPYIARMDDDDIAYPIRLETQLNHIRTHTDVDLCATRIRFVDEEGSADGIQAGNRQYAQWLNSLTLDSDIINACYTECPMPHPTLMAHKAVWESLNGYRDIDGPEDYDLVLRAMLAKFGMGKPTPVLQDWREHSERLTYSDQRYRREAFTQCRAWAASQRTSGLSLHTGRSVWICGTGKNARQWHDALLELGIEVNGFVDLGKSSSHRSKRDKQIISYDELVYQRKDSLVITALSEPGARKALSDFFQQQQWTSGKEYILGA